MAHTPLHVVTLRGTSRQRGLQHGRVLREPIARALDFYRGFFHKHLGLTPDEMRHRAARYIEPTARVSPLLLAEYEGIAEGAKQRLEDIFALSARYEITFEAVALGECSLVFVGPRCSRDGHTLIGQNWDWRPEVLDFRAVLIALCDDMPSHLMVSECGQPGKYGLNAYGLGVAETGLSCSRKTSVGDNLFVVLLRAMIEQETVAAAQQVLAVHQPETAINLLLADASGQAIDVEATPHGLIEHPLQPDEVYWHTNHCRHVDEPCGFENSLIRGQRWAELTESVTTVSRETVCAWLADTHNGADSICKAPDPPAADVTTWLQTLCSIVFDLDERALWVSDGLASHQPYQRFSLSDFNQPH